MKREQIRNFSIIAHIDHGKSTLADRILEYTKAISDREKKDQLLDRLELERERGITIKAQTVRLFYDASDGKRYQFHLIDTPGHVDFHYEVSRSLAACEGALLVVDASQGVEAQTLANVYLALGNDLDIIPVLNKIDLTSADVDQAKQEIEEIIGIDAEEAILMSAKTGEGVHELLEAVVKRISPPSAATAEEGPLRALVYDSWFDSYLGVVIQVRVVDGTLRAGEKITFLQTKGEYEVYKLGVFGPHAIEVDELRAGETGYLSASIKNIRDVKIGDTVCHSKYAEKTEVLPGFVDVKPLVFGGLFPVESDDYGDLRNALEKLSLNDASFTFEPETSTALGFGFRCGYLGLLHMEIIQERLEREFELDLITTAPNVVYQVTTKSGEKVLIENPAALPEAGDIAVFEEPVVTVTVHVPQEYVGNVLKLCEDRRGEQKNMTFHANHAVIVYDMPLSEIILDFHDRLKSGTRGYASFDYEIKGYAEADLVKLDIRVNGENVDALSAIVHKAEAFRRGQELTSKMKECIDRQMFEVAIQAVLGNKVIARTNVKALRKNVTSKCYGGDITRKRKLLEKQKEGKKRMKQVGKVSIPQEAFLAILKVGEE